MTANPYDRLAEEGDAAWAACTPRSDNPHPHGSKMWEAWFAKWDAAALEGARILKGNGAAALYRAGLETATLLRDMRHNPRTLTTRSLRYRDAETHLNSALARAMASMKPEDSCRAS